MNKYVVLIAENFTYIQCEEITSTVCKIGELNVPYSVTVVTANSNKEAVELALKYSC